jgi:hypothetical protein
MKRGVPQSHQSPIGDRLAVNRRNGRRLGGNALPLSLFACVLISALLLASSALAATATVELGSAASFSVLGGSTITNTGPTTMSADLGLSPGSSVTGAPQVLGQTHVDDAVAIAAKTALTTAFNEAAARPSSGSAGTDLSGQEFTAGVRSASSSLLLSSGTVTLNAQGNANAVFIFQIGSTLTTHAGTTVLLINGAQACNVFWEVGSSATIGAATHFVGTIMAHESITAATGATFNGRLLAQTAAVTLEDNTITTSACAASEGETKTKGTEESKTTPEGSKGSAGVEASTTSTPVAATSPTGGALLAPAPGAPIASRTTVTHRKRHRHHPGHKAAAPRSPARPALPHKRGAFTG